MSGLMSIVFFLMGIAWAVMGRDVLTVLACFLIYAVLDGNYQIQKLREEMEDNE